MNVASAVSFVWDTKPDFPSDKIHKNLIRMHVNQIISFYKCSDRRTSFNFMHIILYTLDFVSITDISLSKT